MGLSLHQLLLFYPNRPRALLAAHKKFLIARTSEVLLAVSIGLIYHQFGSFSLSGAMTAIAQMPAADVPWPLTLAALCVALVALLKCAQLPLHGWLIQVVESPTPVSALLHAGVINLGGVLLLLFAPLLSKVVAAQWLLLLVAGPSAVLAALIMTTRISIKVRLAWSTCAQMGLMLVQCALGLYELALLHLIAHSCYKARAFLTAGSAVNERLQVQLVDALGCRRLPLVRHWLGAAALMLTLAVAAVWLVDTAVPHVFSGSIVPWAVLGLALITLVAQFLSQDITLARSWLQRMAVSALAVTLLFSVYLLLKTALIEPLGLPNQGQNWLADVWVCSLLVLLAASSYSLQRWPSRPPVKRAWIALNAGLYLDEWMTRLTLRWWPVTLTPAAAQRSFLETEVKS
jgi:NAD(P)H-quinone oxidoreductase subunit 5